MKNYKEIQRLTEDMCNVSVDNIDAAFNIGYKQGYMDGKEAKQQKYATALHDIEDTYIKRQKAEYEGSYEDEDGKKYPFEDASIFDVAYSKGLQHGQELRVAEADCAYQCGMKRAWEAARKIYDIQNVAMVKELFGADANYTIHNFTASEAIEKIEAWEKKQNEKRCKNCGHHRSGDVGCEAGGCSLIRENWIPQEKP